MTRSGSPPTDTPRGGGSYAWQSSWQHHLRTERPRGWQSSPGTPASNVFQAIRGGASGFVVKDTDPAELVRGVRAVALLSAGVTRGLISEFAIRVKEARA